MVGIKKVQHKTRVVNPRHSKRNPGSKRAAKKRCSSRKPNPLGELITLGALANPKQQGTTMPKKATPKKKKKGTKKAARKSNPTVIVRTVPVPGMKKNKKTNGSKKRRTNPNFLSSGKKLIESGAYALAGMVAARQLPQLLLQANNTGWKGYLANAATAIGASYVAGKIAGPEAGGDVLVGGGLYLCNRVLTEQFSPAGKVLALSGLGDVAAAAPSTMGTIKQGYFPLPVQRDSNGNPIIPPAIVQAVMSQIPQPSSKTAPSKVTGISRRMAPRFAAA